MTIFSVLLAIGAALGLIWVVYDPQYRAREASLNAGILVLVGALIGGRAANVVVHWEYFQDHLIEIPQVWLGGLSWPGALAGGIIMILLVAVVSKTNAGVMTDRMLPLLISLSVVVWLGCWLTGCAYGPEIDMGLPVRDEWGIWKKRLPLQLFSAILVVALFWGIERYQHHKGTLVPGLATSVGLVGTSLILLAASLLRADPYPIYYGVRLETWAAITFLIAALLGGAAAIILSRKRG